MKIVSLSEFVSLATSRKSLLLCGNGLSINFDARFRMDNLYRSFCEVHKHLITYRLYDLNSNAMFKDVLKSNLRGTLAVLKGVSTHDDFNTLFRDGYVFACSILDDHSAMDWIEKK